LPEGARIHDVFHVGVLKPLRGPPPSTVPALPPLRHGRPLLQPDRVLRASLRRGVWHVLVQWADVPPSDATWEQLDEFRAAHPSFQLEDELFSEGGERCYGGSHLPEEEEAQWLGAGHKQRAVRGHHAQRPESIGVASEFTSVC
jgi:hypothetical protein